MKYTTLLNALHGFHARRCSQVSDAIVVQAAQLFRTLYDVGGNTYYNRDFLFVGAVSDLPADPGKGPRDAVCIEDIPVPEAYQRCCETNLILVDASSNLMELFNCVAFNLADDTRVLNHGLFFAQLDSHALSPSELLGLAYERLHNPLILVSANYRVISYSHAAPFISGEAAAAVQKGKFSDALMRSIFDHNIYPLYQKKGVITFGDQYPPGQFCVLPVKTHGFTIAYLLMQNAETLFFNSDLYFMNHLCALLSEIMARQTSLYSDEGLMHSSLFVDLISRDRPDDAVLLERIAFLKWQVSQSMYLLSVHLHENAAPELIFALKAAFPGARYLVYGDELLLLLSLADEDYAGGIAQLRQILKAHGARGALSGRFSNPLQMHRYYPQLGRIHAIAAQLGRTEPLAVFERYASCFLAQAAHASLQPAEFMPHGFDRLIRYDEEHGAGLIDTLELYLANGGMTQEVLTELNISKSTSYYRLGKIRELCRTDLENGTARMLLSIAVSTYRLFGPNAAAADTPTMPGSGQ